MTPSLPISRGYRPARQAAQRKGQQKLMDARQRLDLAREAGDLVVVPERGLAEFGYVRRQFAAGLSFTTVGDLVAK